MTGDVDYGQGVPAHQLRMGLVDARRLLHSRREFKF